MISSVLLLSYLAGAATFAKSFSDNFILGITDNADGFDDSAVSERFLLASVLILVNGAICSRGRIALYNNPI